MSLRDFIRNRKINNVSSLNGEYTTPVAYANSSLLNFNTGSPDTWSLDLIKLPVKNEGDTRYVRQAVQAASGGRGITSIRKPEGVSDEVFNRKMKAAALEIIEAYRTWDGMAPDSIYELAGLEVPVERSIIFSDMYEKVQDYLYIADLAEKERTALYDIFYDDTSDEFYALAIRNGVVYKVEIEPTEDDVIIGEFRELSIQDISPIGSENKLRVYRDNTGTMRWLSIASVAVLNRVNEIDSRELFDSFISYAERTNNFPVLNVYHLGEGSSIGKADFLARHGYVYIAGGTFTDDIFGRTAAMSLQERDDWGNSIEFYSPRAYIETFNIDGAAVQIPVYKNGINTGITIVKERDAASVFTLHKVRG